jgi:outer membrane immunogenic protein
MKRLLVAGIAAAAFCSAPAMAADMPVKAPYAPIFNWTGLYGGFNVGYGWGDGRDTVTPLPDPATFNAQVFSLNHDPKGWLGGVQLGYNWQINRWIAGIETDIDVSGMKGNGLTSPILSVVPGVPFPNSFHSAHEAIQSFGTLRGRLGFLPTENLLVFATGGLAYGQVKLFENTVIIPGIPVLTFQGSPSNWRTGWTIGGGAEWAMAPRWTVKAEYLYFDLGTSTFTANPLAASPPFATQNVVKTTGNIVRLGLNYEFGTH